MNAIKKIVAFLYKDSIILVPKKKAVSGLEYVKEPVIKFDINNNRSILGSFIHELIDQFETGSPDLKGDEFKTIFNPILKAVGCKTYNSFWKIVKYVPIELDKGVMTFYATENFGPKGGYSEKEMPKINLSIDTATKEELGEALIKAFKLSSIIDKSKPQM